MAYVNVLLISPMFAISLAHIFVNYITIICVESTNCDVCG